MLENAADFQQLLHVVFDGDAQYVRNPRAISPSQGVSSFYAEALKADLL